MDLLYIDGKTDGKSDLQQHFLPGIQSVGSFFHNLDIVIRKADQSEAYGEDQYRDSLSAAPERQDAACCDAQKDHETAHIGCSGLFQMALRAIVSLCLSGFQSPQKWNQEFSGDSAYREYGQKRDDRRNQINIKMH